MRLWKFLLPLLATSLCFAAQPDRIAGVIDTSRTVALSGNVYPLARPEYDQGAVEPSTQFDYVTLVFAPSATQQALLGQLLQQQQDRSSPYYHRWLTPEQYADQFGLSQADVTKIRGWLESEGFTVVRTARGRNAVTFSGTAAQIESVFKTEIHRYTVDGEEHVANATVLSVPSILGGLITNVRGLHDFRPKPMYVHSAIGHKGGPHPGYTTTVGGNTTYFIAPGDIATLYDIGPLYNASTPIDGTGQKIAIMGQTDIYYSDLNDFRTGFGLPTYSCTTNSGTGLITACNASNFSYVLLGTDPGTPSLGDLIEADLDVEWSGAIAQNAQIIFINAETANGVNDALAYAIDNETAKIISMSYGQCEYNAGTSETVLQEGNSEGITIVNSSGDVGSTACDFNPPGTPNSGVWPNPPFGWAEGGLAVSYPASSPEVTGVGGTSIPSQDFSSTYWNSNGSGTVNNGGSALAALIGQEVAWNDDEALANYCIANASNPFCNPNPGVKVTSAQTFQQDYWISEGGGGVSNCYNPSLNSLCSSGFPRPSWQTVAVPGQASPQSTYRLVPDVSLLASPNFPGYIICTPVEELSSTSPYDTESSSSCANGIATAADGTLSGGNFVIDPSIIGGTSASTPVFAGILALVSQNGGVTTGLGNINQQLYSFAGTPSNGIFHPVITGDDDVFCQPGDPSNEIGDVICPAGTAPQTVGFEASNDDAANSYNLVAGLGSVDANKLAVAWAAVLAPQFTLSVPPTPLSVGAGGSVSSTITVAPIGGATPTVSFTSSSCANLPSGATCSFSPPSVTLNGSASVPVTVTIATAANMALASGATITITPSGSSITTSVSLTVTATNQSYTIAPQNGSNSTYSVTAGQEVPVNIVVSGQNGFITSSKVTALPLSYTVTGLPSEATYTFSPSQNTDNIAPTLNITTTAATTELRKPFSRGNGIFFAMLLPGVFGIVFAAGSRGRGARLLGLIVVLGLSTLWFSACGGSSSGSQSNPGTPAGSYKVTVNATTGAPTGGTALTGSFTITLTVQ